MEKRTLYALLAKPVRRWEFLLGKFGGLVAHADGEHRCDGCRFVLALSIVKQNDEHPEAAVLVAVYFNFC